MCTLDAQTICASFGDKEILVPTTPRRTRELATKMKQRASNGMEVFSLEDIVQDVNRMIEESWTTLHIHQYRAGVNAFQGACRIHRDPAADGRSSAKGSCLQRQRHRQRAAARHGAGLDTGRSCSRWLGGQSLLRKGDLATNVRLMERMVRIARELGFEPATLQRRVRSWDSSRSSKTLPPSLTCMKIAIIGGGPAGLLFAYLMKRADASHQVRLFERDSENTTTVGTGVSDVAMAFVRDVAPQLHQAILTA